MGRFAVSEKDCVMPSDLPWNTLPVGVRYQGEGASLLRQSRHSGSAAAVTPAPALGKGKPHRLGGCHPPEGRTGRRR